MLLLTKVMIMMNENKISEMVKSLIIWRLNSKGESIPLVHERVLSLLETINPGKWGQDVLDLLISEGLVKCTIYGSYELTVAGIKERKKLPKSEEEIVIQQKPIIRDVAPWASFRKLVGYYADCVKHQERSQQYLFAGDYGKKYFLPVLPYGWLKELGENSETIKVKKNKGNLVAINTILTRKSYEEEVYIGYPMEAFHHKGKTHYVPITLIPVDVIESDSVQLSLRLRLDEADINHSWLEYHVKKEDHKVLQDMLTRLHSDDEYTGLIDVKRSLPYLEQYARGCTPGMFNPDDLSWVLPKLPQKGDAACNCAALFVGTELKYSRTLLRELKYIAKEKDEVLDKTALAYVFREPALKFERGDRKYAFPFIGSNDEQQLAVSQSLNAPVTLVTGPPGTGKSQVAVNIIANHAVRGKSVLFTSRNHKAVHAISERCIGILRDYHVDLVQFCSTPDGQVSDEWFKKDISLILSKLEQLSPFVNHWSYADLMELEERWDSVTSKLEERDFLEAELSRIQARVEEMETLLRRFLKINEKATLVEWPDTSIIKGALLKLCDEPKGKGRLKWCKRLLWKWIGKKRDYKAREILSAIFPLKVNKALTSEYIRTEAVRYLKKYDEYCALRVEKNKIQKQCASLLPLDVARTCLQDEVLSLPSKLVPALLSVLNKASAACLEDEDLQNQLVNLQNSFRSQNELLQMQGVNDERVEKSVIMFERFLKLAPAWATTMLSLPRSAPCLPAVYDTVIIDEASQCDVPPMIPALYRAKRAVIIGDPQQFPPVVTMRDARNEYLLAQHHLNDLKYALYNYRYASAYSIVGEKRVMLTNHYRCHPEIADYFNDSFYNGRLNICTVKERLQSPSAYGLKHAVDWVDVPNSVESEINAVVERVGMLAKNGYHGSVGVVTPLRKYANILDEKLNVYRHSFDGELIVNTVNAFQGGEKDVIIFMLSYTGELMRTQNWYLTSESNRYIYNVAVSRARACLVLVGDRKRCAESGYSLLRKLAELPRKRNTDVADHRFDSVWEERFYNALVAADIQPQTQYHLVGRRLDMAVITENVKLDIEVDGVRWHVASSGGRKVDDLWRDIQVESAGWTVLRFWVYELEADMSACVKRVKEALAVSA